MKKLILILSFIFSASTFGQSIKAQVNLSPAGSFTVKSSSLRGSASIKGGGYTSKKLSIKVRKLKSGLDLRDEHLHKRLGKKSKIVVYNAVAKSGKGSATIEINNIKKKISFKYKEQGKKLLVTFNIKLSQYGITGINYAGVGVEDNVTIKAQVPIK